MLIALQFDVIDRDKDREGERENIKKHTRSKSTKTVQPAESHLQLTRKKVRTARKKHSDHPGRVFTLPKKETLVLTIC